MADFELPKDIHKNLTDKSQEKRHTGAQQVQERFIKQIVKNNDHPQLKKFIAHFEGIQFLKSQNVSAKKGGLMALTQMAQQISEDKAFAKGVVKDITNPILNLFSHSDNKIKFAAVEAMYFVSTRFGTIVLENFETIFEKLVETIGCFDEDVKKATQTLDTKLKGIVNEASQEQEYFNLKKFMPVFKQKIKAQNPAIRPTLLNWIISLDQFPNLNIIDHLPDFLKDIFLMLADQSMDIKKLAEKCLDDFLKEIKDEQQEQMYMVPQREVVKTDIHPGVLQILLDLARQEKGSNNFIKYKSFSWLQEYLQIYLESVENYMKTQNQQNKVTKMQSQSLGQAIEIKIPDIIDTVLNWMSLEEDLRRTATFTNDTLLKIFSYVEYTNIDVSNIMPTVKQQLGKSKLTSDNSLVWMKTLLRINDSIPEVEDILGKLTEKLYNQNGELTPNVIDVLGNISLKDQHFEKVIQKILDASYNHQENLVQNSDIIIKRLCQTLSSRKIFQTFAKKLQYIEDMRFVAILVQSLDTVLLTDPQLSELRQLLKNMKYDAQQKDRSFSLFQELFQTWCYNPVSTITICFLAQQYELAYNVIMCFQDIEMDSDILIQISKLVGFLESQHFIYLRLSLLEHQKYPFLLKSLQGLMMLLPQGKAFNLLKQRLECIGSQQEQSLIVEKEVVNFIDIKNLLEQFKEKQKRRKQNLQSVVKQPGKKSSFSAYKDLYQ